MKHKATGLILLNSRDNVAIATDTLPAGTSQVVNQRSVTSRSAIPGGHKIAIRTIRDGEPIIKYGQPIGLAKRNIDAGMHVHTDNLMDHHVVSDDPMTGTHPHHRHPSNVNS